MINKNFKSKYQLITELHEINTTVTKNSFFIIKNSGSNKWQGLLNLTSKSLEIGFENIKYFIDHVDLIGYYGSLDTKNRLIKSLYTAIKNNETLILNSLVFKIHALIELRRGELNGTQVVGNSSDALRQIKSTRITIQDKVEKRQREIYSLIVAKSSSAKLTEVCFKSSAYVSNVIDSIVNNMVNYHKIARHHFEDGVKNNTEKILYEVSLLNKLLRDCICSVISSHKLIFTLCKCDPWNDKNSLEKLILLAAYLPFKVKNHPNGTDKDIAEISSLKENTFVQIQGVIFSTMEKPFKSSDVTTRLIVESIKSKKSISVYLPFFKASNYGISEGAYINLNGRIAHDHPDVDEDLVIFGDKIDNDHTYSYWQGLFLNSSAPLYRNIPGKLNMAWTLNIKK